LNVAVPQDRRKGGRERRRCPECGGNLDQVVRKLAGGTVTASTCLSCGWSKSSRQTDADLLVLKLVWSLELEPHSGQLAVVLPQELVSALKAKAGDSWEIAPLTSPLGSLPMKWTLSHKRARR
jgi:hypothetical protein